MFIAFQVIKINRTNHRVSLENKQRIILKHIRDLRRTISQYEPNRVFAMEEITVCYDKLGLKKFEFLKGTTYDLSSYSVYEKNMFTVILTVGADGSLMRSLVIFMKNISNLNTPGNLKFAVNENGGLNSNMMKMYPLEVLKNDWGRKCLVLNELLYAE